jgi:uncharacterized OsmC-like protein
MAIVRVKGLKGLQVSITTGRGHVFVSDEPPDNQGDGAGPSPYELLLASLGS